VRLIEDNAMPQASASSLEVHAGSLRRYLYTLGADVAQLDDLVQEAFVIALNKNVQALGAERAAAYLRGIGKNLILRARRFAAAKREVELAHEVWEEECGAGPDDEVVQALRLCAERLPERSRLLLSRAYVEGLSRSVIASEFGMRPGGLKTALRRLRAELRACIARRIRGVRS